MANVVTDLPSEVRLVVGDLARLVQAHQPGREHLRVHAVAAAVALGEQRGDRPGHGADAGLQRGAFGDERARALGDRAVGVAGRGVVERQRLGVALDQQVDLVDVQRVRVLRRRAGRSRAVRRHSTSSSRSGSAPGAMQFVDARAGVQRERAQPSASGGDGDGRHHARAPAASSSGVKRRKSAGAKEMLAPRRAARARSGRRSPTGSGRLGCLNASLHTASSAPQMRRSSQSSRAGERLQELGWLPGAQRQPERVARAQPRDGLGCRDVLSHRAGRG